MGSDPRSGLGRKSEQFAPCHGSTGHGRMVTAGSRDKPNFVHHGSSVMAEGWGRVVSQQQGQGRHGRPAWRTKCCVAAESRQRAQSQKQGWGSGQQQQQQPDSGTSHGQSFNRSRQKRPRQGAHIQQAPPYHRQDHGRGRRVSSGGRAGAEASRQARPTNKILRRSGVTAEGAWPEAGTGAAGGSSSSQTASEPAF